MITTTENGNVRTIQDDMNPRIYKQEFKCIFCGFWYDEDDVITTDDGKYLCQDCQSDIDEVQNEE